MQSMIDMNMPAMNTTATAACGDGRRRLAAGPPAATDDLEVHPVGLGVLFAELGSPEKEVLPGNSELYTELVVETTLSHE